MTLGNRIKTERNKKGWTQAYLGEQLNVSQQAVGKWEKNLAEPDSEAINKMADMFNTTTDYLIGRKSQITQSIFDTYSDIRPVAKRRVPMLGEIACGEPIYAAEDRESYVEIGTDLDVDFCLIARGDSMIGARIRSGDLVFCRKQDSVENGEIGVVVIGDDVTLKRVYYYPEKQKLVLQAENPKYEPFVYVGPELNDIHIIGKAVAFQSDII